MSAHANPGHVKLLSCPACGAPLVKAYFARAFRCARCEARITSNIVAVTNWEGVLALLLLWLPFSLITRIVGEAWYANWALLIVLVGAVHFMALTAFVHLEARPGDSEKEKPSANAV